MIADKPLPYNSLISSQRAEVGGEAGGWYQSSAPMTGVVTIPIGLGQNELDLDKTNSIWAK
jgi:hypothetical protein